MERNTQPGTESVQGICKRNKSTQSNIQKIYPSLKPEEGSPPTSDHLHLSRNPPFNPPQNILLCRLWMPTPKQISSGRKIRTIPPSHAPLHSNPHRIAASKQILHKLLTSVPHISQNQQIYLVNVAEVLLSPNRLLEDVVVIPL